MHVDFKAADFRIGKPGENQAEGAKRQNISKGHIPKNPDWLSELARRDDYRHNSPDKDDRLAYLADSNGRSFNYHDDASGGTGPPEAKKERNSRWRTEQRRAHVADSSGPAASTETGYSNQWAPPSECVGDQWQSPAGYSDRQCQSTAGYSGDQWQSLAGYSGDQWRPQAGFGGQQQTGYGGVPYGYQHFGGGPGFGRRGSGFQEWNGRPGYDRRRDQDHLENDGHQRRQNEGDWREHDRRDLRGGGIKFGMTDISVRMAVIKVDVTEIFARMAFITVDMTEIFFRTTFMTVVLSRTVVVRLRTDETKLVARSTLRTGKQIFMTSPPEICQVVAKDLPVVKKSL